MHAKLSTHVLDTYHGGPGSGIAWTLERQSAPGQWSTLATGQTNHDGRTDEPLLEGAALQTGVYRITFQIGHYFRRRGVDLPEPSFLEAVVVQVGLQAGEAYHVPLLTSPWNYSTYRGS
ncbi:MAG: hydroxyisourate hydrolase [Puniceicoccaceae bacterium]|nr:MAG: hydroxyisourate hydrolase [Puniceicoccaceae bacterium]